MTDLHTIADALTLLPALCPDHGTNTAALGDDHGLPRCEGCRPVHARREARRVLGELQVAYDVHRADQPLPPDLVHIWARWLGDLEHGPMSLAALLGVVHARMPRGWALVRLASLRTAELDGIPLDADDSERVAK